MKVSQRYASMTFRGPAIFFFFFNDTATTEIYTLSLHDALPIYMGPLFEPLGNQVALRIVVVAAAAAEDRKSTRLNSSHQIISYAVFCLKKKKKVFSRSRYRHRL